MSALPARVVRVYAITSRVVMASSALLLLALAVAAVVLGPAALHLVPSAACAVVAFTGSAYFGRPYRQAARHLAAAQARNLEGGPSAADGK